MTFFPRKHEDYDEAWIVGSFHCDGSCSYMAWDGVRAFGDTFAGDDAARFDSLKEAKNFLESDEEAKDWVANHENVRIAKIRIGYTVYPPKGAIVTSTTQS